MKKKKKSLDTPVVLLYNRLQIQPHCQDCQAKSTTKRLQCNLSGLASLEESPEKNGKGTLIEILGSSQQWPSKEVVSYMCGLTMELLLNITLGKKKKLLKFQKPPLVRCSGRDIYIHLPYRVVE